MIRITDAQIEELLGEMCYPNRPLENQAAIQVLYDLKDARAEIARLQTLSQREEIKSLKEQIEDERMDAKNAVAQAEARE